MTFDSLPPREKWTSSLDYLLDGTRGGDAAWQSEVRKKIEEIYLTSKNPYRQSGMTADAARWERGRRPITRAFHKSGTFLDIGSANGMLMESAVAWALEDGIQIEPYGLEISPGLVELAKHRLPQWRDCIFHGNALDWTPPFRFDLVRASIEYVPPGRERHFVDRLLREFVAPDGRLIVAAYGSARPEGDRVIDIAAYLRHWGFLVEGETSGNDTNGVTIVRVAWIPAWSDPVASSSLIT